MVACRCWHVGPLPSSTTVIVKSSWSSPSVFGVSTCDVPPPHSSHAGMPVISTLSAEAPWVKSDTGVSPTSGRSSTCSGSQRTLPSTHWIVNSPPQAAAGMPMTMSEIGALPAKRKATGWSRIESHIPLVIVELMRSAVLPCTASTPVACATETSPKKSERSHSVPSPRYSQPSVSWGVSGFASPAVVGASTASTVSSSSSWT